MRRACARRRRGSAAPSSPGSSCNSPKRGAMRVERLALPEVMLIVPDRHGDARGYFSETFNAARFAEIGIGDAFVQDNES
ncbi:MAG: dTDP-4-dehydrorhamnose 3,5-epimerase family protein, partial [Stellaceae bacterium]